MSDEVIDTGTGQFGTGWYNDPALASQALGEIASTQPTPALFAQTPAFGVDSDEAVLLWLAEVKLFGMMKPSWNQGRVGTCVSFGWARASNDVLLGMASRGEIDIPEADVATEPIYGGSRVEVGGGRIGGDGSVGGWAAKWCRDWGLLLRKQYGQHDLRQYSESKSRDWGRRGCPDDLEPLAKQFPVKSVALVRSGQEAWDAIGSGYAIPVCSNRGFTSTLREGFCDPSGSWAHCMEFRGRVIAKRGGRAVKALACQNSWGGYLSGDRFFVDDKTGERHELPEGCFLVELGVADAMLRQDDSFAISDLQGFPKRQPMDWLF